MQPAGPLGGTKMGQQYMNYCPINLKLRMSGAGCYLFGVTRSLRAKKITATSAMPATTSPGAPY